jgi:hypothetical protein
MKKSILILSSLVIVLASCAHQPITHSEPVVDVLQPTASTIYNNGDTIHIEMTLSDEDELHEAFIYVRSDIDTFFNYEPVVHELPSFNVDTFWVVSGMTTGVSAFVSATAHNHHDLHTTVNVPVTLVP